ncbi:hypothetical protein YC2023_039682 [Brassica napus]
MAITKKMLLAYVVSIFLIVSSQPCGKTCEEYCVGHINDKWGIRTSCESGACCCIKDGANTESKQKNVKESLIQCCKADCEKSLRYKLIARNNLHKVITIEGKVTCRRRMLT